MNSIALVSANIGGFDHERKTQYAGLIDVRYYLEPPFPLQGLNNRMKAKYCKIKTHEFLQNDNFFWIDGSMQLKNGPAASEIAQDVYSYDVVITDHPKRPNAYEELLFVMDHVNSDPYLQKRYDYDAIQSEIAWLRAENHPENAPLYACGFFLRQNSPKVNAAFDEWWDLCVKFSEMDQASFSYIAHKHKLKIKTISYDYVMENIVDKQNHIGE